MKGSTPKNILLLIPDLGEGGAERSISRLSVELARNYNVYLCRFSNDKVVYPYGGKLIHLDEPGKHRLSQKVKAFFSRRRKLKKLKQELDIHVAISFLEGANYMNVLSRCKEKCLISVRGSISEDKDFVGISGWVRRRLLIPRVYKRADQIIALSSGLKEELINSFNLRRDSIIVIYNSFDIDELMVLSEQNVSATFKNLLDKPVIVTAGRLHQQKGHREFLRVFMAIRKLLDCRFVIFGDGVLREEEIQLSRNLGLKTYSVWENELADGSYDVYFMGYVKDPFAFMAASTIFVFPSLYEGFGNSLVEALACRLPVLSSDCHSGPREILAPDSISSYTIQQAEFSEFGILMPVLNNETATQVWIQTLVKVMGDTNLLMSYRNKAIKRVQDFTATSIMKQWHAVVNDCANK